VRMRCIRAVVERRGVVLLLLVLATWAAAIAFAEAESNPLDVTLRSSTEQRILFEYHPGDPFLAPWSSGEAYEMLQLPGAAVSGSEGAPGLPARRVAFGVPHGARVDLRVVATGSQSLGTHRLAPVARWEPPAHGWGLGSEIYEASASYYASDAPYPDDPARIVLDSVFRGQRIIVVELVPFRYRAKSGALEFLGPMTVALDLSGGEPEGSPPGVDLHEDWFRRRLGNYESARNWRAQPVRRDARKAPVGFEQGTDWVKLGITRKGMYRVSGSMLADAGLSLSSIDPNAVRLFSGGGRPLPEDLDPVRVNGDWMEECSIWVRDGGTAGVLDPDDEVIFYGLGAQGWADDFDARLDEGIWWRNVYTDTSVYWLTTGGTFAEPPRRMDTRRQGWDAADVCIRTSTPQWIRDEENRIENFEISYEDGWMYTNFDNATHEQLIPVTLEGVDTTQVSRLVVRLCGQRATGARHEATVSLNGVPLVTASWVSSGFADLDAPAQFVEGENLVGVKVATSDTSDVAEITLAWIDIRYGRSLTLGGQVPARSPDSTCVVEYQAEGANPGGVFVFDVTEHFSPVRLDSVQIEGTAIAFRDSARADSSMQYRVVADWESCAYIRTDDGAGLRTDTSPADVVIIYHPLFRDAALSLAAHRSADWRVRAVSIDDVYDEFSWGLFDPVAIRDFLAFASGNYTDAGERVLGYALLFGDASFNYRAEGSITIPNYVPSWHGRYRRGPDDVYSTDDWYAYLDPSDELMDVAVGRLPVQTQDQAEALVEKIIAYGSTSEFGPWRTRAVIAGDDLGKKCVFSPCEPVHTMDADALAMQYLPDVLALEKIYLPDYAYSSACFKPGATEAFRGALDEGALITLFIGHGDRSKLADEELYVWNSSQPPTNAGRPTFFLAGSCDVGDFAQPSGSSLGENLLRQPESGAVAVFSSTYLAYSLFNYRVIRGLFSNLFPDRRISDRPVGDALMLGKNDVRFNGLEAGKLYHNERLELLGDPSMRLATPRLTVEVTSSDSDPIRFVRRDSVSIHGQIMQEGSEAVWFNGDAWIEAGGTADTSGHWCVNHLGQPLTGCSPSHIDYNVPGAALFRGRAAVVGGVFDATFVVPWDAKEGDLADVRVYVSDDQIDGAGIADSISVAGIADTDDLEGPRFAMSAGGDVVGNGSRLSPQGTLRICFEDDSGINIQGLSDTSAVLLVVDGSTFVDLTDVCEYETGSHTRACAEHSYSFDTGSHSLELRAIDNMGNRNSQTWNVTVSAERELRLSQVYPYPNPFMEGTYLCYRLSRDAEVTVRIFTVSGHLIRKIEAGPQSGGPQHVFWDGRDEEMDEVANGAYLFKIDARTEVGTVNALGKALRLK